MSSSTSTVLGKRPRTFSRGADDPFATGMLQSSSNARRRYLQETSLPKKYEHSVDLIGHYGCVNTLNISPNGRWLASGGDDKRILIWDTFSDICAMTPSTILTGHQSNIFSVSFSKDNTKLFSGANDDLVHIYDLEVGLSVSTSHSRGKEARTYDPINIRREHMAPVNRVDAHPVIPTLFISSSQDGTVRQYDTRTPDTSVGVLYFHEEEFKRQSFNDCLYNPQMPEQIATAGPDSNIFLHDVRTCFGTRGGDLKDRAVMEFATNLSRRKLLQTPRPECNSLAFSPCGTLLAAHLSHWAPTLWSLDDPLPVAIMEGEGFLDNCTTKHGAFGSVGDRLLFAAGSDNYDAFVWEVPPVSQLKTLRQEVDFEAWMKDETFNDPKNETAFAVQKYTNRFLPARLPAHERLTPHRSIVNNVIFHPTLPYLFTSGIEKRIIAHSPLEFSNPHRSSSVNATEQRKRIQFKYPLNAAAVVLMHDLAWTLTPDDEDDETELYEQVRLREDEDVILYFDALAQDEANQEDILFKGRTEESRLWDALAFDSSTELDSSSAEGELDFELEEEEIQDEDEV
ncbi:WD40 repeat-like protein [Atractiella rhizophila]|nr:WD40 repeat-like protein [Atractiella rhizophila]